jgi:hypothetical protein
MVFAMIKISKQASCENYKQYRKSSFKGVVVKKFIDKSEHSFPFIYLKTNNRDFEKLNLNNDSTSAYNAIQMKDSLVKFKDNPWIYKIAEDKLLKLTIISCGCDSLFTSALKTDLGFRR